MRNATVGLAAILGVAFAGPAVGMDETEEIEQSEQPGAEIEMDVENGQLEIKRKSGAPVFAPGAAGRAETLEPLDDPDTPIGGDPIDNELPGEGPEDLSGPDDDDPLPE
jgi:hypothetical protein